MMRTIAAQAKRVGKRLAIASGMTACVAISLLMVAGCNSEPANVPGSIKADKKSINLDPLNTGGGAAEKGAPKDRTKSQDQTPDKKQ